ncbi:dipeptidase PepV [Peribacillus saganii]|uniref:Dipeptidase PepV n=1 Tax=Peribacillus saganii TaxID=2303992 RepID=A0A372LMZ1_9BACI|nr:dipeptidase PepV [Peribacillus saganii]RFU68719.1 dipeptidase PepV [Peribacillus saganii]
MNNINWHKEAEKRREDYLQDTVKLLQVQSVLDEENNSADAPLGEGIQEALEYMLNLGEKDGFAVKNIDNLAGHIEMGEGDELVGILCHLDVVPAGDGWSSDPFAADIRDGKIFARGAIDDKGPTMAAYYAMKIVKELGVPLHKRVRMILGTDEETDWRCVDRYFETEEMPTLGFAPDADFPIIYAEKGIWDLKMKQNPNEDDENSGEYQVLEFTSGRRVNMVPDFAKARVKTTSQISELQKSFNLFLQDHSLQGESSVENNEIILQLKGKSAHGMEPDNGINAGLFLSHFLSGLELSGQAKEYFQFIAEYIVGDSRGRKLNLAFSDSITGDLTMNAGIFSYSKQDGGSIGFTVRYPVTFEWEKGRMQLDTLLREKKFSLETVSNSAPHHVEKDSFLIQTLQKVYEELTGEKAELLSIGGGTYARSLEAGVAFGPLFPGSEDNAHQKDEFVVIDDIIKATAIYAQAIYQLAK